MASTHTTHCGAYSDLNGRKLRQVGVSDMAVSADPKDRLVTFSLGSCVGLAVYDPAAAVGGLMHCLMPDSRCNPADASAHPARYIDTGVASLLNSLKQLGACPSRLVVHLAGAIRSHTNQDLFHISKQNERAIYRSLADHQLRVSAAEMGGRVPLTLSLDIDSGVTTVRSREAVQQISQAGETTGSQDV